MSGAAEAARGFVAGRQRADLDSDTMLLFALVRAVEISGEAASKASPEMRATARSVPWSAIAAMRQQTDPCLFRHRPRHRVEDRYRGSPSAAAVAAPSSANGLSHGDHQPGEMLRAPVDCPKSRPAACLSLACTAGDEGLPPQPPGLAHEPRGRA